jgi:hypothetical protein
MREHMFIAFDDLKAHYSEFPIDHSTALRPSSTNLEAARLAYQWFGLQRVPCALSNQLNCYENMRARIDLGDYIGDVSSKLIRLYPAAWMKNVIVDWLAESFNYSYVDRKEAVFGFQSITVDGSTFVRSSVLDRMITWAVRIEAPLLTLCYIVALGSSVLGGWRLFGKAKPLCAAEWGAMLLAVGAVTTIAVMCAIAGFNRIYHLPLLAIFVLCAAQVVGRRWGTPRIST